MYQEHQQSLRLDLGNLNVWKSNASAAFQSKNSDALNLTNSTTDNPSNVSKNLSNDYKDKRSLPHLSGQADLNTDQRYKSKLQLKCILKDMFNTLKQINNNSSDKMDMVHKI